MTILSDCNVKLWFASSELDGSTVPGMALVFPSRQEAIEALEIMTEPVRLSEPWRSVGVELTEIGVAWRLTLTVHTKRETVEIEINNIDANQVNRFCVLLGHVAYYFIVFGHDDQPGDACTLIDPSAYALFRRDITVAGEVISGANVKNVDWTNILGEEARLTLG